MGQEEEWVVHYSEGSTDRQSILGQDTETQIAPMAVWSLSLLK